MNKYCLAALLTAIVAVRVTSAGETPGTPPPGYVSNPIKVNVADYLDRISLPPGFSISIFAENIEGPRSMALGDDGTVFVGTFGPFGQDPIGKVYAIRDSNGDNKADEVITLAEGLFYPNGVAFHDGDLYVAEINRILRYADIERNLEAPGEPVVISDDFPDKYHHGWKFIRFGPDSRLYVPVGAPCNICEPEKDFALIASIKPDGSGKTVYARGIRNTVGFDWHPVTGELWFTDNGRDAMGDDIPPEELNHAPRPGLHFGFPYRYGKALVDTTFSTDKKAEAFQPAALEMPAHRAPLGMRFYTGDSFPEEYHNQIFIAHHGSWNRSTPDGFTVSLVRLEGDKPVAYEDFASGWLIEDKHWGRPVDVQVMPDGSMLISDDMANVIYRISYEP